MTPREEYCVTVAISAVVRGRIRHRQTVQYVSQQGVGDAVARAVACESVKRVNVASADGGQMDILPVISALFRKMDVQDYNARLVPESNAGRLQLAAWLKDRVMCFQSQWILAPREGAESEGFFELRRARGKGGEKAYVLRRKCMSNDWIAVRDV